MERITTVRWALGALTMTALLGAPAFGQATPQALDSLFTDYAANSLPGCAVGVSRGATPLATRAYGMADLEHGVPLTPQSVFYMASVSKQFMALSILLLERDGKLQLDDRVSAYIPELPDHAAAITIQQLLNHTSGLRDYLALSWLAGHPPDYVITERSVLNTLARQAKLNFEPGTEYLYSNSGYVLLSIIAARVAGRPLDAFARERIFTPLGMHSTRFQHDHSALIIGRAIGYERLDDAWHIGNSMLDVVGDGGLYSSVDDMLRWATAFERPEFAPLLSRMQTPGTLADGRAIPSGYGMGLVAGRYRGVPTVSHGGSLAGYRTGFFRLPDARLTVVILCNTTEAGPGLAQRVAALYAPDGMSAVAPTTANAPPQAPERAAVPRDVARAAAGVYYSAELDATYRLAAASDTATLQIADGEPFPLRMIGPDRLGGTTGNWAIALLRDAAGHVNGFTVSAGRVRDIRFVRR